MIGLTVLVDPSAWSTLKLVSFTPKTFLDDDVEVAITHCGICGSDVHTLTQGWGQSKLPLVVGHEITGIVTRVGANVSEFKPGDRVGVGAQVASCGKCTFCKEDNENYCMYGTIHTYVRCICIRSPHVAHAGYPRTTNTRMA